MKKNKIILWVGMFIVASVGIFLFRDYVAKGATYGWIQTNWGGGIIATQGACEALGGTWANSVCVANHTNNQNNWQAYSAVDANVTAGDSVSIVSEITALTHTLSTDFSAGTSQGTLTTGDQVSLDLP